MRDFKKNSKISKILYSRVFLLFLFFVLLYFCFVAIKVMADYEVTKINKDIVKEQVISLKDKENRLQKQIEDLKMDKGTEDIIREKYRLTKEGEGLLIIVDEDIPENINKDIKKGFFNSLLMFFKKVI